MQQQHNKNGFTLIESLLVLSIASIMSLTVIMNIVPMYHKKIIDTFLDQFEKDVLLTQQFALVNESTVYILFLVDQHQYKVVSVDTNKTLLTRKYHADIKIEGVTLKNRVTYNGNGSIQKSGTLHITYHETTYKAVFYLGKGRMNIEKL
ncbi:competence type IV pilus minor pilin ComGD [uncultured Metabacillus sp.]|uniref:competence type IV pilus minor pilin ComGD n=1 Tax=Metabacillus sp. Hm71 TaxID=3450743 RepID=UPI002623FB92|nr:competence type IV pilus minor pilin ComGD [uncultured Metabacillus sp.]